MISVQERRKLVKMVLRRLEKVIELKSHDYGNEGWQDLGLKGNFADVHKKYVRLKELVWKGVKPRVKESIEDTYLDLTNYGILGMVLLMSGKVGNGKQVARKDRPKLRRAGVYI